MSTSLSLVGTSSERACDIMGKNVFGIPDAVKHLSPSIHIEGLARVPWSDEALEEGRETNHILVADIGTPIIQINREIIKVKNLLDKKTRYQDRELAEKIVRNQHLFGGALYTGKEFATSWGRTGWHLIKTIPVEGSMGKTYKDQRSLLAENEEVPDVRSLYYAAAVWYLKTHEQLFKGFVRSCDVDKDGYQLCVDLLSDPIHIHARWGTYTHKSLGLASEKMAG